MLNAQIAQNQQLFEKTSKKSIKLFWLIQKFKLHEIKEKLNTSEGSVFTTSYEYFSMRKMCSKQVSHLLTVDKKHQHIDDSEHYLELFK